MSGRVAMARWRHFEETLAFYCSAHRRWIDTDGAEYDGDEDDLRLRPLVVIDPEDREQVQRLAFAVWERPLNEQDVDAYQAALRNLASPRAPKPDEPQGLGAVVRDDQDRLFVREFDGWWRGYEPCTLNWAAVDAVEVLSEGYVQGAVEPLADWERDLLRGGS